MRLPLRGLGGHYMGPSGARQEGVWSLLREAPGLRDNVVLKSLVSTWFPMSTYAIQVPSGRWAQGPHAHTTALFTSTPLVLCEEVMGYSATPVPFSSFLSGFLLMAL